MGWRSPGKLRGFSDACIIMLTAKAEDVDRVVGLSVGADDYVSSRCLHGSWSHASTPCCAAHVVDAIAGTSAASGTSSSMWMRASSRRRPTGRVDANRVRPVDARVGPPLRRDTTQVNYSRLRSVYLNTATHGQKGPPMKKLLSTALITGALLLGSTGAAFAHQAGPCNDSDGDGAFSGREYAEHHIVQGAHDGIIGHVHKPGSHRGFSACDPSAQ